MGEEKKIAMISQPMAGKDNLQIQQERTELIDILTEQGYEVLNTILSEEDVEKDDPIYYLAESLKFLAESDIVFFMQGWKEGRGCRIEHMVAEEYGKEIIEL